MREIIFRAWHPKERKMVYFDFWDIQRGEVIEPSFEGRYCFLNECIIMQYIGRKDKNGKEIYEGDVVGGWQEKYPREIRWEDKECSFNIAKYDEEKVIGNKWENPELLNRRVK